MPLVEVPDVNVKFSAEICLKVFLFNPILFPFNHSGAVWELRWNVLINSRNKTSLWLRIFRGYLEANALPVSDAGVVTGTWAPEKRGTEICCKKNDKLFKAWFLLKNKSKDDFAALGKYLQIILRPAIFYESKGILCNRVNDMDWKCYLHMLLRRCKLPFLKFNKDKFLFRTTC